MVRHEAADALASIGEKEYLEVLTKHLTDASEIVADTCTVAVS